MSERVRRINTIMAIMANMTTIILYLFWVFFTLSLYNILTLTVRKGTVCAIFKSEYTSSWSQETNKEVRIVGEKVRRITNAIAPTAILVFYRWRGGSRSRLVHKISRANFVFDRGKNSLLETVYIQNIIIIIQKKISKKNLIY